MQLDRRLLGWGVFFILLGAVPLAVRANALDPTLVGRWPTLWPVLLIGWGIGLVLRPSPLRWVGGVIVAVTFGLMGGGAIATGFAGAPIVTGCGSGPGTPFETAQGSLGTSGHLAIEFSCGHLTATPVEGSGWQVSGVSNDGRGPTIGGDSSNVTIRSPRHGFDVAGGRTEWSVAVPRSPHLDFGVTLNAGDGSVDLAGTSLDSADLTVNAGSLGVDLSRVQSLAPGGVNATVNAGEATLSLPPSAGAVDLSLNAGALTVCLPAGTPLEVNWSGTIASNDLDGSGLVKTDSNTWMTAGLVPTTPHITLNVSANAGSFSLSLGGSCGA